MFPQILNMIYVTLVQICKTDYVLLIIGALGVFVLYACLFIVLSIINLTKKG